MQKRLFPPSVKVTVTEYTPSAYIKIDGKTLLVNSELRVLTDTGNNGETLPTVTGLAVTDYKLGEILKTDENEKFDITKILLSTLEATVSIYGIVFNVFLIFRLPLRKRF